MNDDPIIIASSAFVILMAVFLALYCGLSLLENVVRKKK